MIQRVLVDAGPLVAFIDKRDKFHAWALTQFDAAPLPLETCEAVLCEACYLLRKLPAGVQAICNLVHRGDLLPSFRLSSEIAHVQQLLARYQNLPMSLADACLVRMAELLGRSQVMTVDSDFRIYRKHGRQVIPLLFPDDS